MASSNDSHGSEAEKYARTALMKTNDELDNVNTLFDEYMLSKDKKDYNKAVETMKVAVAQGRELDSNPLCKTPENNPLLIQIMNKVKHLIIRARSLQLETLNEPSDIANKGQQTVNNKQIVAGQLEAIVETN